jgi:hypothetical protein
MITCVETCVANGNKQSWSGSSFNIRTRWTFVVALHPQHQWCQEGIFHHQQTNTTQLVSISWQVWLVKLIKSCNLIPWIFPMWQECNRVIKQVLLKNYLASTEKFLSSERQFIGKWLSSAVDFFYTYISSSGSFLSAFFAIHWNAASTLKPSFAEVSK